MQEMYSISISHQMTEPRIQSKEVEMIVMRRQDQLTEGEVVDKVQEEEEEDQEEDMETEILKLQGLMLREILIPMTQDQKEEEMLVEEESMKVLIEETVLEEAIGVVERRVMVNLFQMVKTMLKMLQSKEKNKKFRLNQKSSMKLLDNLMKILLKLDPLQALRQPEKLKVLKMQKS
jgi:hypothetical protein